jgi:hypothetical protein
MVGWADEVMKKRMAAERLAAVAARGRSARAVQVTR